MPAPLGPLVGFVLGTLFAWIGAEELARGDRGPWSSRVLVIAGCFGLLVLAPVCGFFLAIAPDWSLFYFVRPERLPPGGDFALVLAAAGSVPLGVLVAAPKVRDHRRAAVLKLLAAPAVVIVGVVAVAAPRLAVNATYGQFHNDFGVRPVAGTELGYAVLWMLCVLALATCWTVYGLRARGRSGQSD